MHAYAQDFREIIVQALSERGMGNREVFRRALEKVQKENLVGQAIEDGMSAQEAFKKFGVM
jgi:hypothetical protein